jgi:copper(I)-binding protein
MKCVARDRDKHYFGDFTMLKRVFTLTVLLALLAACAPAASESHNHIEVGNLEIQDPWVRAASLPAAGMSNATPETGGMGGMEMGGANSAAYLTIVNKGSEADQLVSANSDVAKAIELHNVKMENNVMKMFQVPAIDVPANGKAELKPGGFHVMLIGLTRDLKVGEKVKLTLNFQKAGSVTLEAEVREAPMHSP